MYIVLFFLLKLRFKLYLIVTIVLNIITIFKFIDIQNLTLIRGIF